MKAAGFLKTTICAILVFLTSIPDLAAQGPSSGFTSRAEKRLSEMTLDEKIAQLLIIRIQPEATEAYYREVTGLVGRCQVGGVCFFKGGPTREAILTNRLQSVSKVPLFVAIDGEWGPAMRLDSCTAFPRQMTLGALSEENGPLIYCMGREVARQCKAAGINLNFAPCIDINNNARNPVINSRSFGEDREKVTEKAALYLKGMQDGGIIGCLKHFPGHGDTETDSHLGLPVISKSRAELEELELYPYRRLLEKETQMVMVGHLNVPALDPQDQSVASLSKPIITGLLKNELGHSGLVVTDGMEMKGLRTVCPEPGEAEISALAAGADLLLLPGKTEDVIHAVKEAVLTGRLPQSLIDNRCLRVLTFKEEKGLYERRPVDITEMKETLMSEKGRALDRILEKKAVTLLNNPNEYLPLNYSPALAAPDDSILLLCIGREGYQAEYRAAAARYGMACLWHERNLASGNKEGFLRDALHYRRIIVVMAGTNQLAARQYDVDKEMAACLGRMAQNREVVLLHMGNPYALELFPNLDSYKALIVGYQPTPESVDAALQACFGKMYCEGMLPVSINGYPAGSGLVDLHATDNYSNLPAGITRQIDSVLLEGIRDSIFPGCVMLAMKEDEILYSKAFGHYTYDGGRPVRVNTMFDIASVTKPAATALALMKLYDEGRFRLNDNIAKYVPYLKNTDKAALTVKELLTHTSGLPGFIPFYRKIQDDPRYLRKQSSPDFAVKVADSLYLRSDYPDTMRYEIAHCTLGKKKFAYSDLNFFLLMEMVENIAHTTLEEFLAGQFYLPMGLVHTCFCPLQMNFGKEDIAPTEWDRTFRRQLVQGYVHDQTSALFGGTAGNAGLFSTAGDLAKIFRMLLRGGEFEGRRYLSEKTVNLFTSAHEMHGCRYRALGFSVPRLSPYHDVVPSAAGLHTFGHSGFTGTVVWADPENGLVYILLTNRIYPDMFPNRLSKSGIRFKVQELVYRGMAG